MRCGFVRTAIFCVFSVGVASAQIPTAPPLCSVVQRFLDRNQPTVTIDLSCHGSNLQQRALSAAGFLDQVPGSGNCQGERVYRPSAKFATNFADWEQYQHSLVIPVGAAEALSEQQCGRYVQYSYRITLNGNGLVLAGVSPAKSWPVTGPLPHGITLADAGRSINDVLFIHYVRDLGWMLDYPRTFGWPGTFPACPTASPTGARPSRTPGGR